ncbi:MAG: tryptophan-rich sensory protein [Deltaproteobacteria bacterium]|nr:tryptophan-rich sensory protein [Deltaproteobacteria bacterium]
MRTEIHPDTAARSKALLAAAGFAGAVAGASALGARSSPGRGRWYRRLRKPPFQPPSWVFAPVWTALYALIALSGHRVWRRRDRPGRNRALALWAVQLGLNATWSPLFFRARRPGLALADLGLLWLSVVGYTAAAREVDRPAAWAVVPYLGWTSFAFLLNEEIVRRNPSPRTHRSGWRLARST